MGRPRAFDEDEAVQAAARLFAENGYEGTSVDDLVTGLGVHRGSLYKVFNSKRGLYLAALRRHIDQHVLPAVQSGTDTEFDAGPAAGLLLYAAVERAPQDPEVASLVAEAFTALDQAHPDPAALLGAQVRARAERGLHGNNRRRERT